MGLNILHRYTCSLHCCMAVSLTFLSCPCPCSTSSAPHDHISLNSSPTLGNSRARCMYRTHQCCSSQIPSASCPLCTSYTSFLRRSLWCSFPSRSTHCSLGSWSRDILNPPVDTFSSRGFSPCYPCTGGSASACILLIHSPSPNCSTLRTLLHHHRVFLLRRFPHTFVSLQLGPHNSSCFVFSCSGDTCSKHTTARSRCNLSHGWRDNLDLTHFHQSLHSLHHSCSLRTPEPPRHEVP